jgi:hypothetical protein
MRKSWVFVIALVTIGLLAGTSWAGRVSISGTHSANEIRKTCDRVDGVFTETGGSYSCSRDCGGELCSVECKRVANARVTAPSAVSENAACRCSAARMPLITP